MNLQQLKYLSILAQTQNYTQAAKILHITQPTLSYSITNLEKELNVKLFKKQGRNVVLTEEGRILSSGSDQALQTLTNTVEELKERQTKSETVTIASLRILFSSWLPNMIKEYLDTLHVTKSQPKFIFSNSTGYSTGILDSLLAEDCDIAFCSKINDHPDIEYFPIAEQKLVVVTPPDHPLAQQKTVDLTETLQYKQVTFSPNAGLSSELNKLFSLCGGHPKSAYSVEEDEAVAGMIAAGFGIGVVPEMNILKSLNVAIIPIRFPHWHRLIYMATLKGHYQNKTARSFIAFIRDTCQQQGKITKI